MGTGFNRGLLSDTVFEAHKIYKMNKSEVENDQELTQEEIEEIRTGDYYHKLATVRISQFFLLLIFFSRSLQKFLDTQTSRRRFCFCSLAAQIKIQVKNLQNIFTLFTTFCRFGHEDPRKYESHSDGRSWCR